MSEPTFIYPIVIRTTPEKAWKALTDGEESQKYFFGRRIQSSWKVGEPVEYWMDQGHGLDVKGELLKFDPPRLARFTWHVEWVESMRDLPPATVEYEVEPIEDGLVRVTIREYDSIEKYREASRDGWSRIFSNLKTYLESGSPMTTFVPEPPESAKI